METRLFKIEALSNMHVGSGEINYGLIDNLIQRDPITELPNINSSSLKGALREYFKQFPDSSDVDKKWNVSNIFGSDPKVADSQRRQGSVRFFEADLISIPVRDDDKPFVLKTSTGVLDTLREKLIKFGYCEESEITNDKLAKIFGSPELMDDKDFKYICSDEELPVISRNNLENGQSANLWYEQVLPKKSILCFMVMGKGEIFETFCEDLDGAIVQIGANATIGYGYCRISKVDI